MVIVFFFTLYLSLCIKDDAQEEFGWKLVHGDVFRPPKRGMLLSVMLGCGSQIFIMVFFTLGRSVVVNVVHVIILFSLGDERGNRYAVGVGNDLFH